MSLQSPLGKALGHGSSKDGARHWIAQRLTAVGLVPLGLWFAFSVVALPHGDHAAITAWVAAPTNAIGLILFVLTLVWHSMLGLQVIVEDYVHGASGVLSLIAVRFTHALLAVAGVYSIVVTALGAGR